MRVWFTEIGEPLPLQTNERLHRYGLFTKLLAKAGHDVTWWTSTFTHAKKEFVRNQDCVETINGVRLQLLHGPGYPRNISFARFNHQADFANKFYSAAQKETVLPDVIVTPIPTLETAELAVKFAKEKKIPVIVDIRDEWPDELVSLAPKPLRFLARMVLKKYYDKINYIAKNADAIIGVSADNRDYGLKFSDRLAGELDLAVPVGYPENVEIQEARLNEAIKWWASQNISKDTLNFCFFGTIGEYFDISTVIRAARLMSDISDLRIVLCGTGSRLEQFKKEAVDVPSVIFPCWVDEAKIQALMSVSIAGLAPYRKNTRMSLPNKPFEYMSGSLPIVSSITGELKNLINEFGIGINYNSDSDKELADALRVLIKGEKRQQMGYAARALFQKRFTTEATVRKLETLFQSVISKCKGYPDGERVHELSK